MAEAFALYGKHFRLTAGRLGFFGKFRFDCSAAIIFLRRVEPQRIEFSQRGIINAIECRSVVSSSSVPFASIARRGLAELARP